MSNGNYKIKWRALLPLFLQGKKKNNSTGFVGLINIKELEGLPYDQAKGLLNDAINRNMRHLTETQVYMRIIDFMVDCEHHDSKLSKQLYKYCDELTNILDNG